MIKLKNGFELLGMLNVDKDPSAEEYSHTCEFCGKQLKNLYIAWNINTDEYITYGSECIQKQYADVTDAEITFLKKVKVGGKQEPKAVIDYEVTVIVAEVVELGWYHAEQLVLKNGMIIYRSDSKKKVGAVVKIKQFKTNLGLRWMIIK